MIVGLTGGIGCGKSTVLEIFSGFGWGIFNSDGVCRSLYDSGDCRIVDALTTRWGGRILDSNGTVNRAAVADIVFNDRQELTWLNSVFHPLVLEKLTEMIESRANDFIMCDVPLLYESGWDVDYQYVVSVWADKDTQYSRLRERGWNDNEIQRRLANQLSADVKLEKAGFGIINVYSKQILYKQCQEIDSKLRMCYAKKKI